MEEDLITYIKADSETAALIGTRIFPLILPQSVTYPACVYTVISETHNNHLSGNIGGGLTNSLYQIDCYSTIYSETRSVKEALRNLLDGINHVVMGSTFVEAILLETTPADMVEAKDASQVDLYRVMMTFKVSYQESVPTG
jgi:hypothetical protein